MTRCEGRPSEWLSWQTETTTLARSFLTHSALESDDDDGDGDGDERKAVCATKVVFEATCVLRLEGHSARAGTEIWIMLDKYDSGKRATLIDLSSLYLPTSIQVCMERSGGEICCVP